MDRRQFLTAGSMAAAAPVLAALSPANASVAAPPVDAVDLATDGAGLSPQAYAAHLQRIVTAPDFSADYYSNGGTCRVFLSGDGLDPQAFIAALRRRGITPPWQVGDSAEMAV